MKTLWSKGRSEALHSQKRGHAVFVNSINNASRKPNDNGVATAKHRPTASSKIPRRDMRAWIAALDAQ